MTGKRATIASIKRTTVRRLEEYVAERVNARRADVAAIARLSLVKVAGRGGRRGKVGR